MEQIGKMLSTASPDLFDYPFTCSSISLTFNHEGFWQYAKFGETRGDRLMGKPEIDPAFFFTQEYADNPYPTLKILRDHYPVYYNPLSDQWMISRYEDVVACFRDNDN